MFVFKEAKFILTNVNTRPEFHGDEKKLAMDLQFKDTVPNHWLDKIDTDLKPKFFKKKEEKDLVDQVEDKENLVVLNMPKIKNKTFEIDYETDGYRATIHKGCINGGTELNLIQCKLSKFKFTPKEGGLVDLEFKLATYPHQGNMHEVAECNLCLLDETVVLSMEPPGADKQAEDLVSAVA